MEELREVIKRSNNILVLVGAGISVNAGIPDFRSPNSGIYEKYNCQDIFHIETFRDDPIPFYSLVSELFVAKNFQPTSTHWFLRKLKDSGKLLRVYSQNIDGLDCGPVGLVAGRDVIQCHGNLDTIVCATCRRISLVSQDEWMHAVTLFLSWEKTCSNIPAALTCSCGGYLKPNVVLFGESLPPSFFSKIQRDAQVCDLVLVLGSSLSVFPFAAIPALLRDPLTPIYIVTRNFPGTPPSGAILIDQDCDQVTDGLV